MVVELTVSIASSSRSLLPEKAQEQHGADISFSADTLPGHVVMGKKYNSCVCCQKEPGLEPLLIVVLAPSHVEPVQATL